MKVTVTAVKAEERQGEYSVHAGARIMEKWLGADDVRREKQETNTSDGKHAAYKATTEMQNQQVAKDNT